MDEKPKANVVTPAASELVPPPPSGRTYTGVRRVSVDDASPSGQMELDAITRFLQDVGNDDTDEAGMAELGLAWVARRAVMKVVVPAQARELLTMTTWCSGTGRRWAERRTSIRGEHGAKIEAAAVWVHLDPATGRPAPWTAEFEAAYIEATNGRQVDAKLRHSKVVPDTRGEPWTFRQTDMDAFGHVNNAAYLAIAEEFFDVAASCTVEVEWRAPSVAGESLLVHRSDTQLWVVDEASSDLRVTIAFTS